MDKIILFLFLVVFPFGQIIRIGILQPIDVVMGLAAIVSIFGRGKRPAFLKYINDFLIIVGFSWVFSIFLFKSSLIFYGLLYFFRLVASFYFLIYVYNFVHVWNFAKNKINKILLINSLLSISVFSAVFGWIQFFLIPDIKPFFTWGWDIHLFRLVGTFLDPTFLGLIIVFGLLISIVCILEAKNKTFISLITLFLLISLAFTYSRASYLAFFGGLLTIALYKKIFKKVIVFILSFIILIFLLPTTRNHSIELSRSFSIVARLENYQTTLKIFSKSPVFGIGYNNMCIAYREFIGFQPFDSHACSGSDSSLLFILASTGVSGLIAFLFLVFKIQQFLERNLYSMILYSSFVALIIHSLFSNSLFYPWVLGYMMILLAVSLQREAKR